MLAIRLQRTGRSNHAQFRLIVQDSRFSPKSGRVVATLGSYNPHTKAVVCDNEKASKYLSNGAQPSPRAAIILANEGVKLPTWVKQHVKAESKIKNIEKLRRNRPAEPKEEASAEASSAEATEETPAAPEAVEAAEETTSDEAVPAEEASVAEAPAETEEKA